MTKCQPPWSSVCCSANSCDFPHPSLPGQWPLLGLTGQPWTLQQASPSSAWSGLQTIPSAVSLSSLYLRVGAVFRTLFAITAHYKWLETQKVNISLCLWHFLSLSSLKMCMGFLLFLRRFKWVVFSNPIVYSFRTKSQGNKMFEGVEMAPFRSIDEFLTSESKWVFSNLWPFHDLYFLSFRQVWDARAQQYWEDVREGCQQPSLLPDELLCLVCHYLPFGLLFCSLEDDLHCHPACSCFRRSILHVLAPCPRQSLEKNSPNCCHVCHLRYCNVFPLSGCTRDLKQKNNKILFIKFGWFTVFFWSIFMPLLLIAIHAFLHVKGKVTQILGNQKINWNLQTLVVKGPFWKKKKEIELEPNEVRFA